jgi:hypothetical protein
MAARDKGRRERFLAQLAKIVEVEIEARAEQVIEELIH